MQASRILVFAILALTLTTANRSVPRWQAYGNRPLKSVVRCASTVFARLGSVRQKWGAEPEAGAVRVFLTPRQAKHGPVVTAYFEGDARFTSIWMDATDASLARTAWRRIRSNCGVR